MHRKLFWLFLLLLPSQLAFHFWPNFAFISGLRIDYLSPTIFLTDLLFLLAMGFWLVEKKGFHKKVKVLNKYSIIIICYILLNIVFSQSPLSTLFHWLRMLEVILVILYVAVARYNIVDIISTLSVGLLFSAALATRQIGLGQNVGGLLYWLGERPLSISQPGTALISIFGQSVLRPYATFPHPNALAGFAGLTALLSLPYWKQPFYKFVACVGVFVVVISFSHMALIAFLISLLLFFSKRKPPVILVVLLSFVVTMLFVMLPNTTSSNLSIIQRIDLAHMGFQTILNYPFFGTGLGQFIRHIPNLSTNPVLWIQPIHNIPLLLLAELGIFGVGLGMYLLSKVRTTVPTVYYPPCIFVIVTSLFDHYWITAHQNILLLAIIIGVIFSKKVVTMWHNYTSA